MKKDTIPKVRITINLDEQVVEWFKKEAGLTGMYQRLINEVLHEHVRTMKMISDFENNPPD